MSMSELANASLIGRATLYRYFPTKQVLLESIRDDALRNIERVLSDESSSVDIRESLTRIARAVLVQSAIGVLLERERVAFDGDALETSLYSRVDQLFMRAKREGVVDQNIDTRDITYHFLGILRTGSWLVSKKHASVETSASTAVRLLLCGFGPPQKDRI